MRVAAGVTVTLTAQPQIGPYSVFDANGITTGRVLFLDPYEVRAEWWGARGDGLTPSAAAITQALNAGTSMVVTLSGGTFLLEASILPPTSGLQGWTLRGISRVGTTLARAPALLGPMIHIPLLASPTRMSRLSDFSMTCLDTAVGTTGIRLVAAPSTLIQDVAIRRCEYGIHQSGGTSLHYRDIFLEANTRGFQLDNQENRSSVDTILTSVHARASTLYGFNFDASFGPELLREISLYNIVTDGQIPGGGNTCVRLHGIEHVRAFGAHLEACDPFLEVTEPPDGNTTHVLLYGTHLGNIANEPPVGQADCDDDATPAVDMSLCNNGQAIVWTTPGSRGGTGSVIEGLRVKDGTSHFTSTFMVPIRNSTFSDTAGVPTGDGFVLRTSSEQVDTLYARDQTIDTWRLFRAEKLVDTHPARLQQFFATETTTLSGTSLLAIAGTSNGTMAIDATVVARRGDGEGQAAWRVLCLFHTNISTDNAVLVQHAIAPTLASTTAAGWRVTCQGGANVDGVAIGQVVVNHNDDSYQVHWASTAQVLQIMKEE